MLTGRQICIQCRRTIDATADGETFTVTLPALLPACLTTDRCAIRALAAHLRDTAQITNQPMKIVMGDLTYQAHRLH